MSIDPKQKFLLVGGGGRESAFAQKLAEDVTVFAVMSHANPDIVTAVENTGGAYLIGDNNDVDVILKFAQQHAIDYAFVNADTPLANGAVDVLLEHGIKAVGGTQEATRIEWDKVFSIEMMQKVCPEFTPLFRVVERSADIEQHIQVFKEQKLELVVKPQGLTGGKGVKVMPDHLASYDDAKNYIADLLKTRPNEKVLMVEKLNGIEFTVMGLTDGEHLVMAPASYDYPFRLAGDHGDGTGGMGCFTSGNHCLPFMNAQDLADCKTIMQRILDEMQQQQRAFNGVLNGGFFKTAKGIKFMEFNSRFGDPECLNVLSLLQGSFAQLIVNMYDKTLNKQVISFDERASVVIYLVAEEYPYASPAVTRFTVDEKALHADGIQVFFASCIRKGAGFETLKTSRVLALAALADTVEQASEQTLAAIKNHLHGKLDYRHDIGSAASLQELSRRAAEIQASSDDDLSSKA